MNSMDIKLDLKSIRKARLRGLYQNVPEVGPQTVHFDIANACNTRCTTCWHHSPFLSEAHRPTTAWKKERLAFTDFERVFSDILALGGLENIVLSGMGDPTMNDELYDMVALAHRHNIGVTIITNLLRLDIDRLFAAARWPEVQLDLLTSICGVTPESWQAFHAHPTPRGYEIMLERLAALELRDFRPKHVQVINRDNFFELPEMVRFAAAHPVKRVNFKYASLLYGTEAVALTESDDRRLAAELISEAKRLAAELGVDTDLDAFAMQVNPGSHATAPIADVGCFMGFLYARVTVAGEILYCCNTRLDVGHVLEPGGFEAAWRGARWQARRDALRQGQYFEGCEQCGKFKENLKWSKKIAEKVTPSVFQTLIGKGDGT